MFWDFLRDSDYEYYGVGFPKGDEYPQGHTLNETPNIDGYVIASVPSKTFEEVGHSVVMNLEGIVVHDPNPNRLWQDINVVERDENSKMLLMNQSSGGSGSLKKRKIDNGDGMDLDAMDEDDWDDDEDGSGGGVGGGDGGGGQGVEDDNMNLDELDEDDEDEWE